MSRKGRAFCRVQDRRNRYLAAWRPVPRRPAAWPLSARRPFVELRRLEESSPPVRPT